MDPRLLLVVAGLAGSVLLQGPLGEANAERRRNDFRYTPDPEMTKLLSCGHRSTLADVIWLRALPDISREFDDLELKRRWLGAVFGVVTDLEPTFYTAYDFGETYLTLIDRDSEGALDLLHKGVATFDELEKRDGRSYPQQTQLLIRLAMAQYTRGRRDRTLEVLRRAVARPDCDLLTRKMLTKMEVDRRDDTIALLRWAELIDHPSPAIAEQAKLDFARTKREIALRAYRAFEEQHGRPPASVAELADARLLEPNVADTVFPAMELDPDGKPQFPELAILQQEQTIRAAEYWCRLFRRDQDRWPTLAEVLENPVFVMPAPPPGKRWHVDEGAVSLVEAGD